MILQKLVIAAENSALPKGIKSHFTRDFSKKHLFCLMMQCANHFMAVLYVFF